MSTTNKDDFKQSREPDTDQSEMAEVRSRTLADSNRMTEGGVATSLRVPLTLDQVEATTDWFDHFAPSFPPPQRTEVDPKRRLQEDTDDIYDTH